jgi:hypothetical protein
MRIRSADAKATTEDLAILSAHQDFYSKKNSKRALVKAAKNSGDVNALQTLARQSPSGKVLAKVIEMKDNTFDPLRFLVEEPQFLLVAAAAATDAHLSIAEGRFRLGMTGSSASCHCATMLAAFKLNLKVYDLYPALDGRYINKQPTFGYSLRFVLPGTETPGQVAPGTVESTGGTKKSSSVMIRRGASIEDNATIELVMDCSDQIDLFRKACFKDCYRNGKRKDGVDHEPTEEKIEGLITLHVTNDEIKGVLLKILKSTSTAPSDLLKKTSLKHGLL